jgi:hypothetical protein
MNVYVIFDQEGWEIQGIEKIFSTKESAMKYLDTEAARQYYDSSVVKKVGWVGETYEKWLNSKIEEHAVLK